MTKPSEAFDDIPGTLHFNGARCRQGYQLNKFMSSLTDADNRKAFKADQVAYLSKFSMTDEQREAVLKRDWIRMLELGGSIFCMAKLSLGDGVPFQHLNALMSGMSFKDYEDMMNAGGRPMDGIRSKKERN